ncbi:MAG: Glycine oxidase ThiO (EC [uncultured Thiotrichaceae bacterium]|uniref:Glycine oxidase ThiO (EC) n=1 Tax=uncultured Thiotrichaceae bacterium TaxID=298394 RepID=A0A6S6TWI1_9GAMM|nr:MAG: Glycine oxidase ThiO (EC [uncultured Thiotrichaceae bacterium]
MLKNEMIIVGGGIIGLTAAYYLQKAGHRVRIFDQSEIGSEASWAGGGILSPLAPWDYPPVINNLVHESLKDYPVFIEEISAATGMDVEYLDSGMLVIADSSDTPKAKQWSDSYQQKVDRLDSAQALHQVEQNISERFDHAFYLPDVKQIRNPRLLATVKTYLQDNDVIFHNNEAVTEILHSKNSVRGVKTEQGKYEGDAVVVCAGAWTRKFFELKQTKIEPVLGQMLLYKTKPGTQKTIILHDKKYLIPRKDGHILSGSTLEFKGFDKQPDSNFPHQQKAFSEQVLPILKNAEIVKKWCGFRPGLPSGIPYIDEHQEILGLYVNAGHYRYGLTMAHASAKILLERMQIEVENSNSLNHEAYAMNAERPSSEEFENYQTVDDK